jgi:hypothetical protein
VAELADAGILAASGEKEAAIRGYSAAADALDGVAMATYAAAARRRKGELLGGSEGRDRIAEAEASLTRLGVREPGRSSAMYTGS